MSFCSCIAGTKRAITSSEHDGTFRFVYQPTSDGPKKVLVHNSTDHTAVFENLQSEQFSKQAGYLQAFILKSSRTKTEKY